MYNKQYVEISETRGLLLIQSVPYL